MWTKAICIVVFSHDGIPDKVCGLRNDGCKGPIGTAEQAPQFDGKKILSNYVKKSFRIIIERKIWSGIIAAHTCAI
jgi:hypothetical protein